VTLHSTHRPQGMRVNRLLLTNDEEILVSGHIGEVCLWKSADLLKLSSISAVGLPSNIVHHQAASISCLAISDLTGTRPQFLFTACYNDERDCDIRRWRLAQGLEQPRCVTTSPHEASYLPIFHLELSPNGTKLLTAHSSGRISLWDAETIKLEKSISFINGNACITCLVVDRKWTTFSAISNAESTASGIFCYDLIENEEKRRFVCDALPQRMVYSHDGCHLIAGYSDGCIRKWNIKTGQMHLILRSGWGEESACGCAIF
jgi:WD40 repeat protein